MRSAWVGVRDFVRGLLIEHAAEGDPHPRYQKEVERGKPNGYATLDTTGKVPASQLPAGGGGAPAGAEYLVGAADATLTAERVVTNTATVTWDLGTPAQAKANVPDDAVTDAKLADVPASTLKGRGSAGGAGNPEPITLGTGLAMIGTALSATGPSVKKVAARIAMRS